MEPLFPPDQDEKLADLAHELTARAHYLAGSMPLLVQEGIGDLVRSMNCYYSNLIEGHKTKPRDIERALADNYSTNYEKRILQEEARAHIDVQRMIDSSASPESDPLSKDFIKWVHKEFCRRLPRDMLFVKNDETGKQVEVVPGHFRNCDVVVGRHIPIGHDDVDRYMSRLSEVYDEKKVPSSRYLIAVAAAHHRLLWVHPFVDGNGRVARLVSHAMLLRSGVGSTLWSISRGLARTSSEYKSFLAGADADRRGDLDGRGALSAKGLSDFVSYFLQTCIDQVKFMETLLQPAELFRRITLYVNDEISAKRLPNGSLELLKEAYLTGETNRGDASKLTGYQVRRARQILTELMEKGLLVSQGPRAPVRMGFPIDVVERWLPGLYPVD